MKRSGGEELSEELSEIQDCEAMLEERIKEWEKELIEKGLQEGIKQGIEKGRKQGIEEGEAEVLLWQLERKFGEVPPEYRQRLENANSDQLLMWAERILTAESLADVFAE